MVHIDTNAPALPWARTPPSRSGHAAGDVHRNLVVHHQRERAVAVVERPEAVHDADGTVGRDAVGLEVHAVADGHE